MDKHTPGPWTWEEGAPIMISSQNKTWPLVYKIGNDQRFYAAFIANYYPDYYPDSKADSSLYGKIYSIARTMRRKDDVLVINFQTGTHPSKLSNT